MKNWTDRTDQTDRKSFAVALLALASFLLAQTAVVAQARWEDIVRAAEKEGEVTVYATNSVGDLQVIWDAFKKRFPKIKLNSVGIGTTSEIVTKVMAERRAGARRSTTLRSAAMTGWSGNWSAI